jgi:hypothetical protein
LDYEAYKVFRLDPRKAGYLFRLSQPETVLFFLITAARRAALKAGL